MEVIVFISFFALFACVIAKISKTKPPQQPDRPISAPTPDTYRPRPAAPKKASPAPVIRSPQRSAPRDLPTPAGARIEAGHCQRTLPKTITGKVYVIDGDTIRIKHTLIRLAGIDAPEMDHPFGRVSKSAMIGLCRGRTVTAHLTGELSHNRVVAKCIRDDGCDLAAEIVQQGLALDWRLFSGGRYRHLEPADARQKMWRAAKRMGM